MAGKRSKSPLVGKRRLSCHLRFQGHTTAQIAEQLDVQVNTVYRWEALPEHQALVGRLNAQRDADIVAAGSAAVQEAYDILRRVANGELLVTLAVDKLGNVIDGPAKGADIIAACRATLDRFGHGPAKRVEVSGKVETGPDFKKLTKTERDLLEQLLERAGDSE